MSLAAGEAPTSIAGFVVVFVLLGALVNGTTIAVLGYLMEISPDDRRLLLCHADAQSVHGIR